MAKQKHLTPEILENSAKVKYDLELKYSYKRKKNPDRWSTQKQSLSFVMRGRVQQMSGGGIPFPQQTAKRRKHVFPHGLLQLHCQRSTPQVSLTKHPLCSVLFCFFLQGFKSVYFVPGCNIICRYIWETTPWSSGSHLQASIRTMALVQTFSSKFLSDLRLGKKTAYGSISLS